MLAGTIVLYVCMPVAPFPLALPHTLLNIELAVLLLCTLESKDKTRAFRRLTRRYFWEKLTCCKHMATVRMLLTIYGLAQENRQSAICTRKPAASQPPRVQEDAVCTRVLPLNATRHILRILMVPECKVCRCSWSIGKNFEALHCETKPAA